MESEWENRLDLGLVLKMKGKEEMEGVTGFGGDNLDFSNQY